jgi:hypothetical protein
MSRQRYREAALAVLREELTGRDMAIISQVAELRLMSARQITAVHFPLSEYPTTQAATRASNRALCRLVEDRVLMRFERRVGGVRGGSGGYLYSIGPIGHRILERTSARPPFRELSAAFVLHALAVAQLVVDCTLAARDKRFDMLVCQTEPHCWRQYVSSTGSVALRPDLFFALGVGEYEHRFFVEVDMGTEHLPTLMRKCHRYEGYFVSGREKAAYGVSPRTCWIVPSPDRASRLRRAIDQDRRLTSRLFTVITTEHALDVLSGGEP